MHNLYLLLFLLSSFVAQSQGYKQKQFDKMLEGIITHSVPEVSARTTDYNSTIIFLDAREINEYKVSKIKGAKWVGYEDFSLARVNKLDKNSHIIVYCSIGYRSEKITEKLKANGFSNVTNMLGGIFEWVNYNKQLVDSTNRPTKNVHAFNKEWGKWLNGNLVNKMYE